MPLTKATDWSALWDFIVFLELEKYIQPGTAEAMLNHLGTFKAYAFDWEPTVAKGEAKP